jgi:D-alanyl-D-alanine carboxypeptidase/D-alanyl-D-alanine-endopeptidase (penicillin-binding protein 4)
MANFGELNVQYSMCKNPFSMKKAIYTFCFLLFTFDFFGQTLTQKLQRSFTGFEKDSQMKFGIASLYVIDAQTGQVVFDKNSRIGLAPASTQKIITSITAFEMLGKDYRYKTEFWNTGTRLDIIPAGDPAFGSWRWKETDTDSVYTRVLSSLKRNEISKIKDVFLDNSGWDAENIPDGWIWQDIGNYYGAGAHKLNYRENQYDISLKSGNKIGDSVKIVSLSPSSVNYKQQRLKSKLSSAKKGSGDNAYVYLPDDTFREYLVRGTIPVNEENFKISASITNPEWVFSTSLLQLLQKEMNFDVGHGGFDVLDQPFLQKENSKMIYTHYSPTLDSLIYWFNKKSINLYGEAFVKTLGYEKKGIGSTDSGIVVVKDFWKGKGMDEDELGIVDGSGLSPLNRVTTHSQVEILRYAKTKDWFPAFLSSLPEYNGMTMKSGTIRGVKGYCGYHKAKSGKEYIFSFLVNNYNGSPSALVNKMYKLLDALK